MSYLSRPFSCSSHGSLKLRLDSVPTRVAIQPLQFLIVGPSNGLGLLLPPVPLARLHLFFSQQLCSVSQFSQIAATGIGLSMTPYGLPTSAGRDTADMVVDDGVNSELGTRPQNMTLMVNVLSESCWAFVCRSADIILSESTILTCPSDGTRHVHDIVDIYALGCHP